MADVNESLDAGEVGLYELIWSLNAATCGLTETEKKTIAWTVANHVVQERNVKVYELRWRAKEILSGPFELPDVVAGPQQWPSDATERYLALVEDER